MEKQMAGSVPVSPHEFVAAGDDGDVRGAWLARGMKYVLNIQQSCAGQER
jgi:hypothetical protein